MADFGLRFHVREGDDHGADVPNATVQGTIVPATGTGVVTCEDVDVTITAPGFVPYVDQRYHRPSLDAEVPISLQRATTAWLPALHTEGIQFVDANSQRFVVRGATFFKGFWHHLEGIDQDAALDQLQQLGVNWLRIFLNWGYLGFNPSTYGDRFFEQLPAYANRLAQQGFYGEYVVFAPKPLSPEFDGHVPAQIQFAARVYDACSGCTNVVFELGNEAALDSHLAINLIPAPPWPFLWSSGVFDTGPGERRGSYYTYHPRRIPIKLILEMAPVEARWGHVRLPCVPDEPARPDHYSYDPVVAREMGQLCRSQNGGTFHSITGRDTTQPLTGGDRACAEAFFQEEA